VPNTEIYHNRGNFYREKFNFNHFLFKKILVTAKPFLFFAKFRYFFTSVKFLLFVSNFLKKLNEMLKRTRHEEFTDHPGPTLTDLFTYAISLQIPVNPFSEIQQNKIFFARI
jgi:hypothetical protein